MNSPLLESWGLAWLDLAYPIIALLALLVILLIITIVLLVKVSKLKKRYEKFMLGKDAGSMEKEIVSLFDDIDSLKSRTKKNEREISRIYRRLESVYQRFGMVKYDAFAQMGGKMSFALALLDEEENGFILNCIHSSEGCYTYAKEVKAGQCEIALGDEEKEALAIATQTLEV